jgi:hypothetical protein
MILRDLRSEVVVPPAPKESLFSLLISCLDGRLRIMQWNAKPGVNVLRFSSICLQHSLDIFGFEYIEYYMIVRDLIEEYRGSFSLPGWQDLINGII